MKAKVLLIILIILFIGSLIMTGIVHERVVASRDKGMATDWNADHEITGDTDMDQNSWLNQVIENLGAFPGGPVEGQIIWRSDLNLLYIYDGADWLPHTPGIIKGTHYYTISPADFTSRFPDTDDWVMEGTFMVASANGITFRVPIHLPHGAVVTACVIYGDASAQAETWTLWRNDIIDNTGAQMATANIGTEDNTINNATIDNINSSYYISTSSLDIADAIFGGRVTYTL